MIVLISYVFASALSIGTVSVDGVSVIKLCAGLALVVQWLSFVPAYLKQTERFYDLTGSLTYIVCTLIALVGANALTPRALLLASFVMVWATRLGLFLSRRVHKDGGDGRFDELKPRLFSFLTAWNLQGFWVFITASAAWTGILSTQAVPLRGVDALGIGLWVIGFSIEVIADQQKRQHRATLGPARFIQSGLWRYSRHPNYFGEILLWVGVALIALPTLSGWLYASLFSPIFVAFLLTKISGIPLLEARAQERWGDDPDYQAYVASTSQLIPRRPRAPSPEQR